MRATNPGEVEQHPHRLAVDLLVRQEAPGAGIHRIVAVVAQHQVLARRHRAAPRAGALLRAVLGQRADGHAALHEGVDLDVVAAAFERLAQQPLAAIFVGHRGAAAIAEQLHLRGRIADAHHAAVEVHHVAGQADQALDVELRDVGRKRNTTTSPRCGRPVSMAVLVKGRRGP